MSLGALALASVIGFTGTGVLARLLPPEDFGTFATAHVVISLFLALGNLHVDKTAFAARQGWRSVLSGGLSLEMLLGVVLVFVLWTGASQGVALASDPDVAALIIALAPWLLVAPGLRWRVGFERRLRFGPVRAATVGGQTVGLGAAILLAVAHPELGAWPLVVWRLGAVTVEVTIVGAMAGWSPRPRVSVTDWRRIVVAGAPLTATGLLVFWYWNVDYLLMAHLYGERELGYYYFAFQISHYALQFRTAINSVAYAVFSWTDERQIRDGFELATRASAFLHSLPLVLALGGGPNWLAALAGEAWTPAWPYLTILAGVVSVRGMTGAMEPVFVMYDVPRYSLVLSGVQAVLVPLMAVVCQSFLGPVGIALGVLLAVIVSTVTGMYYVVKLLGVDPRHPLVWVVQSLGVVLAIGLVGLSRSAHHPFSLLSALAYAALLLALCGGAWLSFRPHRLLVRRVIAAWG